jgi:hypothetical protein
MCEMGYVRDDNQVRLFADDDWAGMPEYAQENQTAWKRLVVNFRSQRDYEDFCRLLGQRLTDRSDSVWFPAQAPIKFEGVKRYISTSPASPQHPIYIVSKGRSDKCVTSRELEKRGLRHFVIVEPGERELYAASLGRLARVLVLPPEYRSNYDTCDDLGDAKSKGPGPARNFAWDDAVSHGAEWHWVMDDNIDGFYRLNRNLKVPVSDGTIFRVMETFAERYENVGMAGPSYHGFTHQREQRPPVFLNTRIYSCNLIRNDLPYRWRGRYNEDTDLSLRMLKDGWVTVQFNAFLQRKRATQTMKGGNTDEFYAEEGTLPKSQMIEQLHPDVAKVISRWGRWHHWVDYSLFTTMPRLRAGVDVTSGPDDFGMEYQELRDGAWVKV